MKRTITTLLLAGATLASGQTDPGPRRGPAASGVPIPGLSSAELALFHKAKGVFEEADDVAEGLGPRLNLDSCAGCHAHPATGGTSPALNPQIAVATKMGARNQVPAFLQPDGPVRVVRFRRRPDNTPDGGVHALFVITGRADAPGGCNIAQPDFSRQENLSFRIPTPVFGLGLIESIPDGALRANLAADGQRKRALGIGGRFNTNGNDGTITRFGWKAQNKSLLIFSGEAYNVEVGVTNHLFPQEREENSNCVTTASPEDHSKIETGDYNDTEMFTQFMRMLAPPQRGPRNPAADRGEGVFNAIGCAACHTPSLRTGKSTMAALSEKDVRLYSDLAIHRMGQRLDDGVSQGDARPDDWRTAPLWGLGERLFFLHDGRTRDLVEAIRQHDSPGSEAHGVILNFEGLPPAQRQDLLVFLRSL